MNVEKKIKNLEVQLARLMRRAKKTAAVHTSPVPISAVKGVSGNKDTVFEYYLPISGSFTKISVEFPKRPKSPQVMTMSLVDQSGGGSRIFNIENRTFSEQLNIQHPGNTKLTVIIESEDPVEKVYVSLLWMPEFSETISKKFLIDELEKEAKDAVS